MVECKSTSRFFNQIVNVILTQTDTTVGFLSQDEAKLQKIKSRNSLKPFIKVYTNFKFLQEDGIRIPNSQKSRVRRSKKTTFIIKSTAFRVAENRLSSTLLKSKWHYSTSANESGKNFDREFCEEKADIIIEDKALLHEGRSSSLLKINAKKIRRLR